MYKTMQHMKDGQAMMDALNNGNGNVKPLQQQPLPAAEDEPPVEIENGEGAMTGGSEIVPPEPAQAGTDEPGEVR